MFWQAKTGRRSRSRQKVLPKRRSIAVLPAVGKQVSDLHPRDGCCDICFSPPKKIVIRDAVGQATRVTDLRRLNGLQVEGG